MIKYYLELIHKGVHLTQCDNATLIARFMGPTWGPSGADRLQVGPINLAIWKAIQCIMTCRVAFIHIAPWKGVIWFSLSLFSSVTAFHTTNEEFTHLGGGRNTTNPLQRYFQVSVWNRYHSLQNGATVLSTDIGSPVQYFCQDGCSHNCIL